MKNLLKIACIVLLLNCFNSNAYSQIEQGNKIVGGSSNLSFLASDGLTQIQVNAHIGYLMTDNLAAGAELQYALISINGSSTSQYGTGVFARYYIGNLYPEARLGILGISRDGEGQNEMYFGGGLGYAISLNDHITIDPKGVFTIVDGDSQFGVLFGFNLYF